MIEQALDRYPVRYPLETSVQCLIRPLEPADASGLLTLLQTVPELERMFIKQRLDNPSLVQEWCADVDYDARLPLLAWQTEKWSGWPHWSSATAAGNDTSAWCIC